MIHLRGVEQDAAIRALQGILNGLGLVVSDRRSLPADGPGSATWFTHAADEGPVYLIGGVDNGGWLPIIEGSFAAPGTPHLSEVSQQLSAKLGCFALCLVVHDDDVLFYNLDHGGRSLDGYNSNPQYFEEERLAPDAVEEQRHQPEAFAPLLPQGVSLEQLEAVLNRGWWNAHDNSGLDEDGVPIDDDDFVDEGDRMQELGALLQLGGRGAEYPYAEWLESAGVRWEEFTAIAALPEAVARQ